MGEEDTGAGGLVLLDGDGATLPTKGGEEVVWLEAGFPMPGEGPIFDVLETSLRGTSSEAGSGERMRVRGGKVQP